MRSCITLAYTRLTEEFWLGSTH